MREMSQRTKIIMGAVGIIVVIGIFVLCAAMFSSNKATPAPMSTVTPVIEETEDCDDEDQAKKQVDECGIGVLLDPGKKSTAPVVKPSTKAPAPRATCVRTPTRRC